MLNFEYRVIFLNDDDIEILERKLNRLGQDGWELLFWDGNIGIFKKPNLSLFPKYDEDGNLKIKDQSDQPEIN